MEGLLFQPLGGNQKWLPFSLDFRWRDCYTYNITYKEPQMAFTKLVSTQKTFLEQHLRGTGRTMSSAQARETYGIMNLRARVCEMRAAGLKVTNTKNTRGNTAYTVSRRDLAGVQGKIFA
jgi:hypothetical protein